MPRHTGQMSYARAAQEGLGMPIVCRHTGQMSYARAAQEGLGMAIVCGGYLMAQVSKENSINTQWVIGGLMDELPEEGFAPQAH